jgi:hypothetical protein
MMLALLLRLDQRVWVLLVTVGIFSLLQIAGDHRATLRLDHYQPLSHDAANWLPPPIFPAALVLVLLARTRLAKQWVWAITGLVFGALTFLAWGTGPLMLLYVPLAAPVMLASAWLGDRIARMLEFPAAPYVRTLVPLLGITAPVLLGFVDLYLRQTIA